LVAKRLELISETVPKAAVLAFLVNPKNPNAEPDTREAQAAANALGRQLQVLTASTERDFEPAFAAIVQHGAGALFVNIDSFVGGKFDRIMKVPVVDVFEGES
jgi:ABC-type uncharacterized transport system substrate-binding protein